MDINRLWYRENIWKLKFKIKYFEVLFIGFKSMKVNEECVWRVCHDNTNKDDNPVLSIALKANGMICWMDRNFISRDANVLEIYKTQIRPLIKYYTQIKNLESRYGNWRVILSLESIQRRVTTLSKAVKDYSYREKLEKLRLSTLLEIKMKEDRIETFQIMEFLITLVGLFEGGSYTCICSVCPPSHRQDGCGTRLF